MGTGLGVDLTPDSTPEYRFRGRPRTPGHAPQQQLNTNKNRARDENKQFDNYNHSYKELQFENE